MTHAAICVALVSATFVALGSALDNDLVNWDDPANFTENEDIRGLSLENLRWMWTTGHMGLYQPLTWMTVGLDYTLSGGLDPRAMHRTSLVFHSINALLFYALALMLLNRGAGPDDLTRRLGAAIAALLFAVHPLRVESVAWATERRDVVSGMFFLLALLAYLRFAATHRGRTRSWFVVSVLFFLCAVLSKVICVTLVAVILVLDVYPLRRIGGGRWWGASHTRVWLEKIPFAIVGVAAAVVAFKMMGIGIEPLDSVSFGERLANSSIALLFYPLKFVWPADLIPIYHLHWNAYCFDPLYLGCTLGVLGVTVVLLLLRRRFPAGLTVWVIYLMMVSPVLSFTQNGFQFAADRYTYLVLMGFCVLTGGGLAWFVRRAFREPGRSVVMLVVAIGVGAVLVPLTRRQTALWHDSITLWEATLRIDPDSWTAHQNLGKALMETGEVELAADHFRIAQETYATGHQIPIELPGDLARRAVELSGGDATAILDAGSAMMESRNWDAAIEIFQLGTQEHPENADMHRSLGLAFVQNGDHSAALSSFRRALQIEPAHLATYENIVAALLELGRAEAAAETLNNALRIHPHWREGAQMLEKIQLQQRASKQHP